MNNEQRPNAEERISGAELEIVERTYDGLVKLGKPAIDAHIRYLTEVSSIVGLIPREEILLKKLNEYSAGN